MLKNLTKIRPRSFQKIQPTSTPKATPQLHRLSKYKFSEKPESNFDNLMKEKSSIPTASIAVGLGLAAVFAYFQFAKKSSNQDNISNQQQQPSLKPQQQAQEASEKPLSNLQSGEGAAQELQNQAKQKFSMGEAESAQEDLELALEVLKNISAEGSSHAAAIHFDMGFYNFYSNKISQARENFNKSFEIYEKNGQIDKAFDTLFMSAMTYEQDSDGGEAFYENIVKKGNEKLSKNDPNLAQIYIRYGLWHLRNERNKKGVDNLGKASGIMKSADKDANKEDLGQAYRQLMNGYKQAKAYPQAIETANQVLENMEVEKEPTLYEDIAKLYSEAKDNKKSLEYYQKYLNLLKKLGKSDAEIGKVLSETATEYERQKIDDQALAFWKEFEGVFRPSKDKDTAALSLYSNLRAFALYHRRKQVSEAGKELDDAVGKSIEILGDEHMYTKTLRKILTAYKLDGAKLEMESLTLILIALEDNLQKLIDTGFINL